MSVKKSEWLGGLVDYLGGVVFRVIGYLMFMVAGAAIIRHESAIGVLGALALGHVSTCAAETVSRRRK